MKIVIEIPEKMYKHILSMQFFIPDLRSGKSFLNEILKAIRMGTPLPKGHGDLIDRNDLLEYTDINRCAYTPTINWYDIITIPTIIEADKGSDSE